MTGSNDILNRLIFIGGSPRSGTTFAAQSLNHHPNIMTAIDDHVFECWRLFYYRTRVGLIQQIRDSRQSLSRQDIQTILYNYLI